MVPKNRIFAFEGVDGCGKTTIIKGVKTELEKKGYNVIVISELGKSSSINLGLRVAMLKKNLNTNKYVYPHQLEKIIKIREIVWKKVCKFLEDDNTIILYDRFFFSTLAYQYNNLSFIDKNNNNYLHRFMFPYVHPSTTFYISASWQNIIKRNKLRASKGIRDFRDPLTREQAVKADSSFHKFNHLFAYSIFKNNTKKQLSQNVEKILGLIL